MRDADEIAEVIRGELENLVNDPDGLNAPEFRDAAIDGLPDSEAFLLTLVDGTKFLVTVTKIEEGGR